MSRNPFLNGGFEADDDEAEPLIGPPDHSPPSLVFVNQRYSSDHDLEALMNPDPVRIRSGAGMQAPRTPESLQIVIITLIKNLI